MRKRGLRARTFRLVCVAMAAVWVSGCAVINPHETLRRSSGIPPTKIVDGIQYADKAKAAYSQAIKEQSQLRSWLGIGLIPLGAAALGLGVTSGPPAAIAALGLTGAAGYGIGTWLESKPNQKAWLGGYSATTCAVDAILPLLYVERNQDVIDKDIASLDAAIAGLDAKIGPVRALLLGAGETPPGEVLELVKLAKERVTEGEAVRSAALETRTKAVQMKQEAAGAGASLKEAVDRISAQVSIQLIEATPDLSTLSSIVGGLAKSYGQFVRVPEERPSGASEPKAQSSIDARIQRLIDDFPSAIAELESATRATRTAIQRVADTVNAVTANKPIEKLRACGVTDAIVAPMTIEPPGVIELEVGKVMTGARSIRGGAAPYFVEPQGDTVDGLSVRKGDMNTAAFVVQITSKTPAGQYLLLVTEKTGQRVFVTVNVKGGQAGGGAGSGTDGAATTNLTKVAEELRRNAPGPMDIPSSRAVVTIAKADVVDKRLLIDVTVKAKTGATTPEFANAVKDDDIVKAALLLKVFKDNGVTKEQVAVREKKAG